MFVSQALPEGASAFDVSPLVSDFQKAVTLTQVRQSVAEKLDISIDDVEVLATRNGNDGGSVEVIAEAGDPTMAENISQSVSTEGMRFLAQRQVDAAEAVVALRQADVDTAKEERDALLTQNQFVNPVTAYNETMNRFNQLTLDRSDPTLSLTTDARVQADAEAARLRLQLQSLHALAEEYGEVEERLADATALLKEAEQKRTNAEEILASATTDVAISQGDTVQTSKLATMLQGFVAAVVATFLAGIAFFFVADSRRRQATPARPAAKPAAGANPPVPAAAPVAAAAAETPARATASSPAPVQAQAKTPVTGSSPAAPAASKPAAAKPMTPSKPAASPSGAATTAAAAKAEPAPRTEVADTPAARRTVEAAPVAKREVATTSADTPARREAAGTNATPVARDNAAKAEPATTEKRTERDIDLRTPSATGTTSSAPTVVSKNGGSAGRGDGGSSMFSRPSESAGAATAVSRDRSDTKADTKVEGTKPTTDKAGTDKADEKARTDKADDKADERASAGSRDRKAAGNRRRLPGS
ncbi:MAG: hypothetical protein R2749_18350 [Acidimicrobiales bacterium]